MFTAELIDFRETYSDYGSPIVVYPKEILSIEHSTDINSGPIVSASMLSIVEWNIAHLLLQQRQPISQVLSLDWINAGS